MNSFTELCTIAYQKERVAARRLAKHSDISEAAALQQILQHSAGTHTLDTLVAMRRSESARIAQQLALRRQEKETQRAAKAARTLPAPHAWQAWFDGSTRPNPGKMGLGGILRSPDGAIIEICRAAGSGDSNEAEFLALIAVLEAAVRERVEQLVIFGDSQVVIGAVGGSGSVSGLQALCAQARTLLDQIGATSLRWIPRHKNGAADALSQRAVE